MENALTSIERNSAPVRDIGTITAEIKDLCRQAQTMALLYAVEIGRRLEEAKRTLPYGAWGEWLKNEVEFSQSTANNFMRLFAEYGTSQISIFGASVDSQTFANLPYSKALQLLAVPKEERESFAKEVNAEDLSVKELKAAIAERDQARKDAEEARAREMEISEKLAEAEAAAAISEEAKKETERLRQKIESVTKDLERSKHNVVSLRERLKKAEENPSIPKETLEQIRTETKEAVKREAEQAAVTELEELGKKLKLAQEGEAAARLAEKQAIERLEEAQRRLKTASPEVSAFKALFDSMQSTAAKLNAMIEKIRQEDAETADKLRAAMKAFGAGL